MNLCFLIGKIISDIKFEFIWNSKNISVTQFMIEVNKNCIIKVKAYDEIADWCYQKLVKSDTIAIQGKIDYKMEIIIDNICYL